MILAIYAVGFVVTFAVEAFLDGADSTRHRLDNWELCLSTVFAAACWPVWLPWRGLSWLGDRKR